MNDRHMSVNTESRQKPENPVVEDKSQIFDIREGRNESKKERLAKALRDNLKRRKSADSRD